MAVNEQLNTVASPAKLRRLRRRSLNAPGTNDASDLPCPHPPSWSWCS